FDDEDRPYNVTDMGADELPTPGIPTNISVTSKPKQVTVTWDEDSTYPSNQYNIQYWPKSDPTNVTILTNTVNSQTITGLKPAKLYFVAVQGQYNSDYSLYADDYSSSLEYGAKPKKVTKLKVLKKYTTATSVKIRWKKYKRINRYVIKVMNKKGKKIKNVTVKKKINFVKNTNKKFVKKVIKNLTPGKTYKVNVRAKKKVGDEWLKGKRSKKKSAKTLSS
ncbi:MAG: fibronectin type III domain-containing protein, partial [Patescibacteria group bacterium]